MSNKLEKFATPHDELMALAGKWEAIYAEHGFDALSLAAQDLRALLDSDAFRAMVRDAERLDALQRYVAKNGGLVLHNGDIRGNHGGLGLANTRRTLRQAIDDMTRFDAAASGAEEGE